MTWSEMTGHISQSRIVIAKYFI